MNYGNKQRNGEIRLIRSTWLSIALLSLLVFTHNVNAHPQEVVVWDQNFQQGYTLEVLKLLAKASEDKYEPIRLVQSQPIEQGRAFEELNKGKYLNLVVMGNHAQREERIAPIYVPLDKAELGLRVCLVHSDNTALLKGVKNVKDTKERGLVFGTGMYWPDKAIIESNGLDTYTSSSFKNLFTALKAKRFDCLSRSIAEAFKDVEKHGGNDLVVDEHIAFVYPLADFIYVKSPELKARFEYALQKTLKSGELQALKNSHITDELNETEFFSRKMIVLENPSLTEAARKAINEHGFITFEANKEK